MKRNVLWAGIGASLGMLVLILDGQTAMEGARIGIDLCLKTVIPSLFPFFLLSNLMTCAFMGQSLPFLRPLGKLCAVPEGAESILLAGFLGGYPVGAQVISRAWRGGQLRKSDAEQLLAFCNNAGPAFLFGMVSSLFPQRWMAWVLWGIHIGSALLVAVILSQGEAHPVRLSGSAEASLPEALNTSLHIMATVCGWVLLFRILIVFLTRRVFRLVPPVAQIGLIGLLELSNGCLELVSIPEPAVRFMICSGMLAFGGLCVTMQTISVTKGLSLRRYALGKLLQTVYSLFLSAAIITGNWLPGCAIAIISACFLRKFQKRSSIPAAVGV